MRGLLVGALFWLAVAGARITAQAPATSPTFEVVSIKRAAATGPGGLPLTGRPIELPNGAIRLAGVPVAALLFRAYPSVVGSEIVGLPGWARGERYDISATSGLSQASPDDRAAMMRAMLADRFALMAHVEKREQSVLALVRARQNGPLGPGLMKIDADCAAKRAAERAAAEAATASGRPPSPVGPPGPDAVPPPCMLWSSADRAGLTRVRGEGLLSDLASMLRVAMRGPVVDRTGLDGSYRFEMTYQMTDLSARGDAAAPTGPDIATALSAMGLKLESSRIQQDALIIERLDRPTEN